MTNFIERVRLVDANSSNKICFEVELDLSFFFLKYSGEVPEVLRSAREY